MFIPARTQIKMGSLLGQYINNLDVIMYRRGGEKELNKINIDRQDRYIQSYRAVLVTLPAEKMCPL